MGHRLQMAIKKHTQTLRTVFLQYLLSVSISSSMSILFTVVLILILWELGIIVEANYVENQILSNKTKIENSDRFDNLMIPGGVRYIFISSDGKILEGNMSKQKENDALKFHDRKFSSNASNTFMEIKRKDGFVIVNYDLLAHYSNEFLELNFPQVNHFFCT